MDIKHLVKKMMIQYIIIYAGSIFGTIVFCLVIDREALFGIDYFIWILFFSLLGDLPILVFYSKRELTEKETIVRHLMHIILLELVLLIAGSLYGMYEGVKQGIFFALIILGVYGMVWFITFRNNLRIAGEVNQRLEERRNKSGNGE